MRNRTDYSSRQDRRRGQEGNAHTRSSALGGLLDRDGLARNVSHRGRRERVDNMRRLTCSSPIAETMVTSRSLPSSKSAWICLPISPSGTLTSSLATPSVVIKLRNPSSTLTCSDHTPVSPNNTLTRRDTHKLVFVTGDIRDVHVVGGGTDVLLIKGRKGMRT